MGDDKQTNGTTGTNGTSTTNGNSPQAHFSLRQYYELTKEELQKLSAESLKRVAFDITEVVMTISGCQSKIEKFREQIAKQLPEFDLKCVDELERYVGALHHAHRMHGLLTEEDAPIAEWSSALAEDHQLLLSTAEILVKEGLIPASRVAPLRPRASNAVLTLNVLKLVEVLRIAWPQIEGKTVLSLERLGAIEDDAVRLTHAIGERAQRLATIAESADTRIRAYTLTLRAYSEVRRAIGYIRWHEGDADIYAPALSNQGKRRPRDTEEEEVPTEAEAGAGRPTASDASSLGTAPAPVAAQTQSTGPMGAPFVR